MARKTNKKKKKKDKNVIEAELFRMMQAMAKDVINAALDDIFKE
jgi:hypothetical protein